MPARNLSASRRREIKHRRPAESHSRYGAIGALDHYAVEEFNRREREREQNWLPDRIGCVRSFAAEAPIIAVMVAIQGYLNWYLISNLPVELSRHTEIGRTMTAVVMSHIGG